MTQHPQIDPAVMQQRKAYYDKIGQHKLAPLWEVLHGLVIPQPKSACQPAIWHYGDIREEIMEAGRLITAKEAERPREGDRQRPVAAEDLPLGDLRVDLLDPLESLGDVHGGKVTLRYRVVKPAPGTARASGPSPP